MSFGGSASNVLSLATLCYDVYRFYRNAPANLQDLVNKLERVAGKLKQFSTNLENSGWGTWEFEPALSQQLLELQAFLEPLQPGKTAAPGKVTRLARLALKQDELKRREKNLDVIEKAIDDIKVDLILACTLRNFAHSNDLQSRRSTPQTAFRPANETTHAREARPPVPVMRYTDRLRLEDDRPSIASVAASNASKAVMMAIQLRSRPHREAKVTSLQPVAPKKGSHDAQITRHFITSVVSLAEEHGLYVQNADPTQNLEPLNKLTEKATHFQRELHSSTADAEAGAVPYQLPALDETEPESLEREIFGHLSSTSESTSMRLWAFDHSQKSQSEASRASMEEHLTAPTSLSDPTPSVGRVRNRSANEEDLYGASIGSAGDASTRPNHEIQTQDPIRLQGRSKVSLTRDAKASTSCFFELEVSEGSVRLRVASTEQPHPSFDSHFASGALQPTGSDSSSKSPSLNHDPLTRFPRIFHHCFQTQARPIPHLLHPSVEGPMEEAHAPYAITFNERQYIFTEGISERPRWTKSLMYIFDEEKDRNMLCEKIFGKTLIMSAGANRIIYDGDEMSHMSAIALWLDDASQIQSVTFWPSLKSGDVPSKDMELKVHGAWKGKPVARDSKVLHVAAEPMPEFEETPEGLTEHDQQPSIRSGRTFRSRRSSAPSTKPKKPAKRKFTIEFTRPSDRALFMSHFN